MRPIDRGTAPRTYESYDDAKHDLAAVFGYYCTYCERWIETHLAVEHVIPRTQDGTLELDWSNFVLSCVHCNSAKGHETIAVGDFLWPDRDNTLRGFWYSPNGEVQAGRRLRQTNRHRARRTIRLVGLDKTPANSNAQRRPTSSDLRWRRRQEVFALANRFKDRLQAVDTPAVRQTIAEAAAIRGLFSIWVEVFRDDRDMCQRLRDCFPGTWAGCLRQTNGRYVVRTGGVL